MATSSAQVYSETRPAFAQGPTTPLYKAMQEYANQPELQALMQKLVADIVTERPENVLAYMAKWVEKEQAQRGT